MRVGQRQVAAQPHSAVWADGVGVGAQGLSFGFVLDFALGSCALAFAACGSSDTCARRRSSLPLAAFMAGLKTDSLGGLGLNGERGGFGAGGVAGWGIGSWFAGDKPFSGGGSSLAASPP